MLVLVGAEFGVHADWLLTELALEALLMPLAFQSGNGLLRDGFLAAATLGSVQSLVVGRAVRFAVAFEEGLTGQLLLAGSTADEVLQMPGFAHGFHHFLGDHLPAGSADGLELGLKTLGAHRESIAFVEFVLDDALLALLACKVLRMPILVQSLQHLVLDLLLASKACGRHVKMSLQ